MRKNVIKVYKITDVMDYLDVPSIKMLRKELDNFMDVHEGMLQ